MNRLEIFANQAVSDVIEERLNAIDETLHYTILRDSAGKGHKGFCLGTEVWPEHNVVFIIYVNDSLTEPVKAALKEIKSQFPIIGLSCFIIRGCEELV